MKSVALVIRRGPSGSLGTREMVDMALVLATFECPVVVILQNAGVRWVALPEMPEKSPLALSGKFKSLYLYDIETILVDRSSLEERKIPSSANSLGVVVDRSVILNALAESDIILEA